MVKICYMILYTKCSPYIGQPPSRPAGTTLQAKDSEPMSDNWRWEQDRQAAQKPRSEGRTANHSRGSKCSMCAASSRMPRTPSAKVEKQQETLSEQ